MSDKEKQGTEFPLGGVFVVLALILGWFAVPDEPFKSSRQSPSPVKSAPVARNHADARLWEDPFSVRDRITEKEKIEEPSFLRRRLHEKIGLGESDVLVLPIMVFGGEYPENVEFRRKSRYATLSALAEQDYYPDHSDRLDFFSYRFGSKETLIPFESFSSEKGVFRRVFILWLDDQRFRHNTNSRLRCLLSSIKHRDAATGNRISIRVLGPTSSDILRVMLEPETEMHEWEEEYKSAFEGVFFLCWSATVDASLLSGAKNSGPIDGHASNRRLPAPFFRTIHTDDSLVRGLIGELRIRWVNAACDHIVVISEWDTLYGRSLPDTFLRESGGKENIHIYSYMRGIDGRLPKDRESDDRPPEGAIKGGRKDSYLEEIEKPIGNSQFDYVRRLSKDIHALDVNLRKDHRDSIKAVGVLGSDIYDKLLILQALSALLPGAIFFTTDLDARFLHPGERDWTRNLVIASSFGLTVPDIQKRTPPFRDSYQASLFHTAQSALTNATKEQLEKVTPGPLRIFEIGRTAPYELSEPSPSEMVTTTFHALIIIGFALIFMVTLMVVAKYSWQCSETTMFQIKFSIYAVLGASALGLFICLLVRAQRGGGEPLTFMEGISIWPTVYLRLVAASLGAALLWMTHHHTNQITNNLQEQLKQASMVTDIIVFDCFTSFRKRLKRTLAMGLAYFGFCFSLIQPFFPLFVPSRGAISLILHYASLGIAIAVFILLLFWVVDTTGMTVRLIQRIFPSLSSSPVVGAAERGEDCPNPSEWEIKHFMRIESIARLTQGINRFVYYPIWVVIVLGVSRLSSTDLEGFSSGGHLQPPGRRLPG